MATTPQDPSGQKPTSLSFMRSLMKGNTLGDIYQAEMNFGIPVLPDSEEQLDEIAAEAGITFEDDAQRAQYHSEAGKLFEMYANRIFDPNETNNQYDHGGGTAAEQGQLLFHGKNESFINSGPSNYVNFMRLEDRKMLEHQDAAAENNRVYTDKNGVMLSIDEYYKRSSANKLVSEYNEELGDFAYRELKDGELGDPANIKPYEWLGGARELNSTWMGSASRGLVGGVLGKTVQGLGGGSLHLLNAIAAAPVAALSDLSYTEAVTNSALNGLANELSNSGSALMKQNFDEAVGAFENANSFLYAFWDGIGQFLPMIASGYTLGAAGVGGKLATQLSIAIGSLTVYDMTRNDMMRKGYSAEQAEGIGLLFGMITHGSENIISANIIQRFGWKEGRKLFNKISMEATAETLAAFSKKGTKGAAASTFDDLAKNVARDMPSKGWFANKYTNSLRKAFYTTMGKKPTQIIGKMVSAGGEEALEEAAEGITQAMVGGVFNNVQRKSAINTLRQYGGVSFGEENSKGYYDVLNKNGVVVDTVNAQEKGLIEKRVAFSRGVLDGTMTIDEDFSWDEPAIAFLSSMATMGIAGSMSKTQSTKGMAQFKLGQQYNLDPTILDKHISNIKEMISRGQIEKSIGEEIINTFTEDVILYAEAIKHYNLDDPRIIEAAGDDALLFELLQSKQASDQLKALKVLTELEKPEDTEELAKRKEEIKAAAQPLGLGESPTIAKIDERLESEKKREEGITKVKTNMNNPQVKAKTSQRFTEKMNNIYAVDQLISRKARTNLKKKYGKDIPPEALAKEITRIKSKESPVILEALIDTKMSPVWNFLKSVIEGMGPEGMKSFIRSHNQKIDAVKADETELNSLITQIAEITGKTFGIDAVVEKIAAKGDVAASEKEIRKAITKGSINEIMNELNERTAKQVDEYLEKNADFRESLAKFMELSNTLFKNKRFMATDNTATTLLKGNLAIADQAQILDKSAQALIEKKGDSENLPLQLTDEEKSDMDAVRAFDEEKDTQKKIDIDLEEATTPELVEALNRGIINEGWLADLSTAPSSIQEAFKYDPTTGKSEVLESDLLRDNFLGLLRGFMKSGRLQTADGVSESLLSTMSELDQVFSNESNPIDDADVQLRNIEIAEDLVDQLLTTMRLLVDVTQNHIEKLPVGEGQEHSIFNQGDNSRFRISNEERQFVDDLGEKMNTQLSNWKKDKRLEGASSQREAVKVKLGKQTRSLFLLRNLIDDEDTFGEVMSEELRTVMSGFSIEIGNIIKGVIDDEDVKKLDSHEIYPEQIYALYHNSKEEDGREKVSRAIIAIDNILFSMEETLVGKGAKKSLKADLSKVLKALKKNAAFEDIGGAVLKSSVPMYVMNSPEYKGKLSLDAMRFGRNVWSQYSSYVRENGKIAWLDYRSKYSKPASITRETSEIDEYADYLFNYFQYISVLNSMAEDKVPTRRQILEVVGKNITHEEENDGIEDVETYEQLDAIVDVVAFLNSDKTDWDPTSEDNTDKVVSSMFLMGQAGSGKTRIASKNSLLYQALIQNSPLKVLYVVLTPALKEIHKTQVDQLNEKLEALGSEGRIDAELIFTHELIDNQDKFEENEIIIYEEGSTIPAFKEGEDNNGTILKKLQEEHRKKLIILGDEGQVANLDNPTSILPIEYYGEKTFPLQQIHRSGISSIRALQETFRAALDDGDVMNSVKAISGKWKNMPGHGKIGLQNKRLNNKNATIESIVKSFIESAEDNTVPKTQLLLVPTYQNKQELIARFPELNSHKDKVLVMEYDSKKVADGDKGADLADNVSGLSADQIFIPFDLETMLKPETGAIMSGIPNAELNNDNAVRMMLTAVSRAKQYVEMIGDPELTIPVDNDTPISGYNTKETSDDEISEELAERRALLIEYLDGVGAEVEVKKKKKTKKKKKVKPPVDVVDNYDVDSEVYIGDEDNASNKKDFDKAVRIVKSDSTGKVIIESNKRASDKSAHWLPKGKTKSVKQKSFDAMINERRKMFELAFKAEYGRTAAIRTKADRDLKSKASAYLNKYMEGDINKERVTGYINRVKVTAGAIAHRMGIREDNKDQFVERPLLKSMKMDINGHPFAVQVLGYKMEGKKIIPIVDIFTLNYTAKSFAQSEEREALSQIYRLQAEEKGWIVNDSKIVTVVDEGATVTTGEETTQIKYKVGSENGVSLKEVADYIGFTRPATTDSKEALFSKKRRVWTWKASDDTEFHEGDYIIDRKTGKTHRIKLILLDLNGVAIQLSGKSDYVDGDFMKKNNEATKNLMIKERKSSAKRYVESSEVHTTHLLVPIKIAQQNDFNKEFVEGTGAFQAESNPWYKLKQESLSILDGLIGETFSKILKRSVTYKVVKADGMLADDTMTNVFEIVLDDDQVNKVSAKMGLTPSKFKALGLDIVGIDTPAEFKPPEFNKKTGQRDFVKSRAFSNKKIKAVLDINDQGDAELEVRQIMEKGFANVKDGENKSNLIEMNVSKVMEVWRAIKNPSDTQTRQIVMSIDKNTIRPTQGNRLSFYELLDKMTADGWELSETIDSGIPFTVQRNSDGRFGMLIRFKRTDKSGETVDIEFTASSFLGRDNKGDATAAKDVIAFVKKAAQDLRADTFLDSLVQDIFEEIIKGEYESEKYAGLKQDIVARLFRDSLGMRFLNTNHAVLERMIKNNKSLAQYFYVHRRSRHVNIRVQGETLRDNYANLQKGLEELATILEVETSLAGKMYYPAIVMRGKNDLVAATDYIETDVTGINKRVVYSQNKGFKKNDSVIKTADEKKVTKRRKTFKTVSGNESNAEFITKEDAIAQVVKIIGSDTANMVLGFNKGILVLDGARRWGAVYDGLMRLALTQNGVEATTAIHESFHFVADYLMGPEQRAKLFAAARNEMGTYATDDDVHEYLAEKLEYGTYKPKTIIGKILQAIKDFLYSAFNMYSSDIVTILSSIENGAYANSNIRSDSTTTAHFKDETADNEYSTDAIHNKKIELFGNTQNIDYWAEIEIAGLVMGYSNVGKSVTSESDFAGVNSYRQAVEYAWQDILAMAKEYRELAEEDEVFKYFDGEVVDEAFTVGYGDITTKMYLDVNRVQTEMKDKTRSKFKGQTKVSYQQNQNLINAYIIQELTRRKSDLISGETVTGRQIYNNLVQTIFPNVSLSRENLDGSPVMTLEGNIVVEKEDLSPTANVNQFMMAMFNATRLRGYTKKDGKVSDAHIGSDNYMDGWLVMHELLAAGDELTRLGIDIDIKSLFSQLKAKRDSLQPGNEQNNIHTFLVEFGNEMSDEIRKGKRDANGKLIAYNPGPVTNTNAVVGTLSGIGYYLLETDLENIIEKLENQGMQDGYGDQLRRKKDEFKKISSMIVSSVDGLLSIRRTKLIRSDGFYRSEEYNNDISTMYHATIRDEMTAAFRNLSNGSVPDSIRKEFLGTKPNFKVNKSGLSIRNPKGVYQKLISYKNGKYILEDVPSGLKRTAIRFITASNSITLKLAESIMEDKQAPVELYMSFAALYSAVLDSEDFEKDPKAIFDEDHLAKWKKSKKAIEMREILVGRQIDNKESEGLLPFHMPMDEFSFYKKNISEKISATLTRSNDSIHVIGEVTKQARETETRLLKIFSQDDLDEGAAKNFIEEVQADAQAMVDNGTEQETQVVYYENGVPKFRDPLLNKQFVMQPMGTFEIAEGDGRMMPSKDMSAYDYVRFLYHLTKEDIRKKNDWFTVFVETIGDRTKIPKTRIRYAKQLFDMQRDPKGIVSMTVNYENMIAVLDNFVESDNAMRRLALKRWGRKADAKVLILDENRVVTPEARKVEQMTEFRDYKREGNYYVIGNQYSSTDSPYKGINISNWRRLKKEGKYEEMFDIVNEKMGSRILRFENFLSKTLANKEFDKVDNDVRTPFTSKNAKQVATALKELSKIKGSGAAFKRIAKEVKALENGNITRDEAIGFYIEIKKEYQKARKRLKTKKERTAFDKQYWKYVALNKKNKNNGFSVEPALLTKALNQGKDIQNMAQIMYWNQHIFNKSINNTVRGGVENYKDGSDYVKRGKNFDAIGKTYSQKYVPKTLRTVTVHDRVMFNRIFSERVDKDGKKIAGTKKLTRTDENEFQKTSASDGTVELLPVLHELMRRSKAYEYGQVTKSAQKTLYFDHSPVTDKVKNIKMAMFTAQFEKLQDRYYESMMEMMFGEFWPDGGVKTEKEFKALINRLADQVESELANNGDGTSETMDKMIAFVPMKTAFKDGVEKIQVLEDGEFNPKWNDDATVDKLRSKGLRLQLFTGNFTHDKKKTIPTQILYILGIGSHNNELIQKLNRSLSTIARLGSTHYEKVLKSKKVTEFVRSLVSKSVRGTGDSTKLKDLANSDASLDTYRKKAISSLMADSNKYFKPTLPGSTLVQAEYKLDVYEEDGYVYVSPGNNRTPRGLNPITFYKMVNGKRIQYTDKQTLLDDANSGVKVIVAPQEVIMPFVHQKAFNITTGVSLEDLMSLRVKGGTLDMRTSMYELEHMTSKDTQKMLKKELGSFDFDEIASSIHPDILGFIRKQSNKAIQEKNKTVLIELISSYYARLNNALDVFAIRIPTTIASSGFPSRIVEFDYNYDNTISTSPHKNILDGSDYDIDELHTYHRPNFGDLTGKNDKDMVTLYEESRNIFKYIFDYYANPLNIQAMLERVTTQTIEDQAKENSNEKENFSNDITSAAQLRDNSIEGKDMVAHYANMQNAISRMFHLTGKDKLDIFQEGTILTEGQTFKKSLELVGRISELINAATDNDSIGGALGKIGFNKFTSPLVTGMILNGKTIEQIVAVTTNVEVRAMEDNSKKNKYYGFQPSTILKAIYKKKKAATEENDIKNYTEWTKYSMIGEKVRRYSEVIGLQQGRKGEEFDLFRIKNSLEFSLGQSLTSFLEGKTVPTVDSQKDYILKNNRSKKEMTGISEMETEIRDPEFGFKLHELIRSTPQFIEYIRLIDRLVELYSSAFRINFNNEFVHGLKEEADIKNFYNKRSFDSMMSEVENVAISAFISEKYPEMKFLGVTYKLTDPSHRQQFVIDFGLKVKEMRDDPNYVLNHFLARFKKRTSWGDIPIYNLIGATGASNRMLKNFKENGFDKFFDDDKKLFRIYNMLVYGFSRKEGNMSDAIDTVLEDEFTKWINDKANIFGAVTYQDVFSRAGKMLSGNGPTFFASLKGGNQLAGMKVKGEMKPLSTPYSARIITYPGTPGVKTSDTKPVFRKLSLEEIEALKQKGTMEFPIPFHGVRYNSRAEENYSQPNDVHIFYNNDEVFLQDGSTAIIKRVSKGIVKLTIQKKAEKLRITHRPSKARTISNQQASALVGTMVSQVSQLFPNVEVQIVSNDNASMKGAASWIENGVVYINQDLITPETAPHEITHLYLAFLRESSPGQYRRLKTAVIALLNNGDPYALKIAQRHSDLGKAGMIEEVMVYFMRMDENALVDEEKQFDVDNGEQVAKGVWASIGDIIKNAWNSIMNLIRDAMGLTTDVNLAHKTLREFAQKSISAIQGGKTISQINSEQLDRLMYSVVTHRPESIVSIKGLMDWISSENGTLDTAEEREKARRMEMETTIRKGGGVLNAFYTGTEETIKLDGLTPASPIIKTILDKFDKRNGKIAVNTATALSKINEFISDPHKQDWLNGIFGKISGDPIITVEAFYSFLSEVGHFNGNEYMSLKDFGKNFDVMNSIPKEFLDDNIVVKVSFMNDKEAVISLINLDSTLSAKTGRNMLAPIDTWHDAGIRGFELTNSVEDISGLKLALIANSIMNSSRNVKIAEAGYARLWSGKGGKSYFTSNLLHFNNQIIRMGKVKGFRALLGNELSKFFDEKNVIDPLFNHAVYLKSLWDTENVKMRGDIVDMALRIDELNAKDKMYLYKGRMEQLIEEFVENKGPGSHRFWKELDLLIAAMKALSIKDVSARQVNPFEKLGILEKKWYGISNIGEENTIFINGLILKAEKEIALAVRKQKKIVSKSLKKWEEVSNSGVITLKGHTLADVSKKRYEKLFDTVTENGVTYRTGAIYWTDNEDEATGDTEKALARRAKERGLTKAQLEVGKELADQVEKLMVNNIMHAHRSKYNNYNYQDQKPFTEPQAKKELYKNSRFYKGFIPMMTSTTDEKIGRMQLGKAWRQAMERVSDIETLFEDSPNYGADMKNEQVVTKLRDNLFAQIGYGSMYSPEGQSTEYGSKARTRMLGLKESYDTDGKRFWSLEDAARNEDLSYNIENIMDYLALSSTRTPLYEEKVLPVINGTILWLKNKTLRTGDKEAESLAEHIQHITDASVHSQKKKIKEKIAGVDVDKVLSVIDMVARPIVMAVNPGVAVLSATANTMFTYIEAFSNKIADNNYFGPKEVNKAMRLVLGADSGQIMQMAIEYGVVNQSEFDAAHFQKWKTLDKKAFSDYWSNYLNWAVDSRSRMIAMVAQMLKEGSYEAHGLDEDGNMTYDQFEDKRFYGTGKTQTAEQKVLYNAMQERLDADNFATEDGFERGYDYETSNTFKALSDMYIVGEFDQKTAPLIANYTWGKSILFLNRYLMARITNAFGKRGKTRQEGGVLTTKKLFNTETGKMEVVPSYERLSGEGYVETFAKHAIYQLTNIANPDKQQWDDLESWEKKNLAKFTVTMAMFAAAKIIWIMLGMIKVGEDDEPLNQFGPIKSIDQAVDSLLVLPAVLDLARNPFAGASILTRGVLGPFGDFHLSNARNLLPASKAYKWIDEGVNAATGDTIIDNTFN